MLILRLMKIGSEHGKRWITNCMMGYLMLTKMVKTLKKQVMLHIMMQKLKVNVQILISVALKGNMIMIIMKRTMKT